MKRKSVERQERRSVLITFLLILFLNSSVVTTSFILFAHAVRWRDDGRIDIQTAAIFTFINLLFITAILFTIYLVWRRFKVTRPIGKIQTSLEKITAGDFEERIDTDEICRNFRAIAESINRMTAELSATETLKTDFIANVSHELKTPLAVIRNYAQLLNADSIADATRKEYAAAIIGGATKLSELITNILRLNKLENQKLPAKRERFDLSAQLTEAVLQYENVWTEKEIEPTVDIPDGVEICSDAELLSLVWNNLLSNAFKFTDRGGTVGLTLTADRESARVEVADAGCGISPEVGRHIFDKFYQGDTSRAAQGNGLGLALVKRVVDLVGGEISVRSTPGEGSVFTVTVRRNADE